MMWSLGPGSLSLEFGEEQEWIFFKKDLKGERKEENEDICKNWCVCMVKQETNMLGA